MKKELSLEQFSGFLTPRLRDAHKGDFGHVLIIGGDYGYFGAVRLAGEAALRAGAGLVSILTRPENAATGHIIRPELMFHGTDKESDIDLLFSKATCIVIGPGLGSSPWAEKWLRLTLEIENKIIIVDADGLNLLAKNPIKKSNWILTPHPGEASRLLKISLKEIQEERINTVQQLQKKYGGVCILKGAGTLIMEPDATISICHAGNPGMATAGMGDVLSGVIGGLVAQHVPFATAAKLGVLVHAMAADDAAKEDGERGMVASDLFPFIRRIMN